ncbi:MAG: T9SS type A sorting domain-containing protein [Bacteroidota bacterium]
MQRKVFVVLLLMIGIISNTRVIAQDFTINVHDNYLVDSLGSEIVFSIDLINNSTQEMGVTIVRNEVTIPTSWSSSLCLDNCFPPHLDSISTSPDYGITPLASGESRVMSLHVYPLEEDAEAIIELKFVNEENPSEQYIHEFRAASAIISVDDKYHDHLDYKLYQNYPNPFNPSTRISYTVGSNDHTSEFVSLKIFDILGREVAELVNEIQSSGNYSIDFSDNNLSSGIYFYELKTDQFHQIKKMILEK